MSDEIKQGRHLAIYMIKTAIETAKNTSDINKMMTINRHLALHFLASEICNFKLNGKSSIDDITNDFIGLLKTEVEFTEKNLAIRTSMTGSDSAKADH